MSFYIALGSNLGAAAKNIEKASLELQKHFKIIEESRIYYSKAVDYFDQPDFFNQVIEFNSPPIEPSVLMNKVLEIEKLLGRTRDIDKGPRIIDIDILFIDYLKSDDPHITLPHPRLFERSFVVLPLMELKSFKSLENHYYFSKVFDNEAFPLD